VVAFTSKSYLVIRRIHVMKEILPSPSTVLLICNTLSMVPYIAMHENDEIILVQFYKAFRRFLCRIVLHISTGGT